MLGRKFFCASFRVGFEPLSEVGGFRLNRFSFFLGEFVFEFFVFKGVLDGINIVFKSVLGFNLLLDGFVFTLVFLGFVDHSFDVFFGESSFVVGDGNLVGFTRGFVSGMDVHDSVLINIERNFDLRNTSGGRGDSIEVEFTQSVVIFGHLSFSFEDLDQYTGLVVGIGGESLGFLGGNGGVSWDQSGHDSSSSFNSEGKRGNIQK